MDIAPLGFSVDTSALDAAKTAAAAAADQIGQLADVVDALGDKSHEAAVSTDEAATSIKESGDTHKETADAVGEHAKKQDELGEATEKASKKVEEGTKSVKEAKEAAEAHGKTSKDVSETTKELAASSDAAAKNVGSMKDQFTAAKPAADAYNDKLKSIVETAKQATAKPIEIIMPGDKGPYAGMSADQADQAYQEALKRHNSAVAVAEAAGDAAAARNAKGVKTDPLDSVKTEADVAAAAAAAKKALADAKKGSDELGSSMHGTSGIVREVLVMFRELARGNMTAMVGSATLLAQRMGLVEKGVQAVSEAVHGGFGGAAEALSGTSEGAAAASTSLLGLGLIAVGVVAGIGAIAVASEHFAREAAEANDEADRLQRSFANLPGVAGNGADAIDKVDAQAKSLGQSYSETEGQVLSLSKAFASFGGDAGEAVIVQKELSDAFETAGLTSGDAAKQIDRFSDAMSNGKVSGTEFRELLSNLPSDDVQALADAMGKTIPQLQEMADQGKLTSSDLEAGIEKAKDAFDNYGREMPDTVEKANNRASDSAKNLNKAFEQAFDFTSIIAGAENRIAGFNDWLAGVVNGARAKLGLVGGEPGAAGASVPGPATPSAAVNASLAAVRAAGGLSTQYDRLATSGKANETADARDDVSGIASELASARSQLTKDQAGRAAAFKSGDVDAVRNYTTAINGLTTRIDTLGKAATGAHERLANLTKVPKPKKGPGPTAFDDLEQQTKEAQAALDYDPSSAGQSIYEAAEKAVRAKDGKASNGTLPKAIQDEISNRLVKFRGTFGDQDEKAANDNADANAYAGSGKVSDIAIDAHFQAVTAVYAKFGNQLAANNPIMKEAEAHFLSLAAAQQKLAESKSMNGIELANDNSGKIADAYASGGAVAGRAAERSTAIATATADIYDPGQKAQMTTDLQNKDTVADHLDATKQLASIKEQEASLKSQESLWGLIGDHLTEQQAVLTARQEIIAKGGDINSDDSKAILAETAALAEQTAQYDKINAKVTAVKGALSDLGTGLGSSLMAGFDKAFQHGGDAGKAMMVSLQNVALQVLDKIMEALVVNPAVSALSSAVGGSGSISNILTKLLGGTGVGSTSDLADIAGGTGDVDSIVGFSGITGASMRGNVFGARGMTAFMGGGIVSRPTKFMMSGGDMGMAGEAGPEAVVPLRRGSDGRLGVASGGGSDGTQVVINDMRSGGSPVEVQQRETGDGRRQMQVMIRDSVRQSISDGSFDSANASQYGISRSVTRR